MNGVPGSEIEIAVFRSRRLLAPGKRPLLTLGRSISGAMKLGLCRQPPPFPPGVGLRLGVRDKDRPCHWKRQQLEHTAPKPTSLVSLPEERVPHLVADPPFPALVVPKLARFVAAAFD